MTRPIVALLLFTAFFLGAAPVQAQDVTAPATSTAQCALFFADAAQATTEQCSSCHSPGRHSHPVDLDYASLAYRAPSDLRPIEEVQRRGVRLVDGKLACVTCHDASSKFQARIALPGEALVRPRVELDDPRTFEEPVAPRPAGELPEGAAVSATPLCKSCHRFD